MIRILKPLGAGDVIAGEVGELAGKAADGHDLRVERVHQPGDTAAQASCSLLNKAAFGTAAGARGAQHVTTEADLVHREGATERARPGPAVEDRVPASPRAAST